MPHEVRVVHRNLRWEVRVDGIARPMIDWLCTRERAIDHAHERARDVDARVIVVEGPEWSVEDVIHVDRPSGLFPLATSLAPMHRSEVESCRSIPIATKNRAFAAR
jgi:hypothetical protein